MRDILAAILKKFMLGETHPGIGLIVPREMALEAFSMDNRLYYYSKPVKTGIGRAPLVGKEICERADTQDWEWSDQRVVDWLKRSYNYPVKLVCFYDLENGETRFRVSFKTHDDALAFKLKWL